MSKGRMVHALLQHLPDIPAPDRAKAAAAYVAHAAAELTPTAQVAICASVLKILEDTALSPLFGPGSRAEAPITGVVGDVEIGGLIDRLAIAPEKILIADFKTDRQPPDRPEAVPAAYLRQLAAYRALLMQIYPSRHIQCTSSGPKPQPPCTCRKPSLPRMHPGWASHTSPQTRLDCQLPRGHVRYNFSTVRIRYHE